jgi:hypothetical protein
LSWSAFSTSRIEGYHFISDQHFKTFMGTKDVIYLIKISLVSNFDVINTPKPTRGQMHFQFDNHVKRTKSLFSIKYIFSLSN